ncbi:MAG: hypothetical protein U1E62_09075 [Alsobacter sp.]
MTQSITNGAVGFWSVLWSMAGFSLAISPGAPGPFRFATGLSLPAMEAYLQANGIDPHFAPGVLAGLGVLFMAVGAGFALSLYAARTDAFEAVAFRACIFGALLLVPSAAVGAAYHPSTLMTHLFLFVGLAVTVILVKMDAHADMPLMPVEADRFEEALRQRMAEDKAFERYSESCRTSSATSPASPSDKLMRSVTRQV